jgi:hypothetical protein
MPCEHIAPKLGNVGFNIEDTIFEMTPAAYLHQGKDDICQFAIAQNPLDKYNNGNFLFGGLFLKHFYSIYDFDNELISLGVNSHSANQVYMHGVNEPIKNVTLPEVSEKPKTPQNQSLSSKEDEKDKSWSKSNGTDDHEESYIKAAANDTKNETDKAQDWSKSNGT